MTATFTKNHLSLFIKYLKANEKSSATIEKYSHDILDFLRYAKGKSINKQLMIDYKENLLNTYKITSANSKLGAINSFLRYLNEFSLCVKQFKVQRESYSSEEKELTKGEYFRLVNTAKQKNNQKLSLIIQTICSTGIRVSELKFITLDAVEKGEAVVRLKGKVRKIFILPELKFKLQRYIKENKITEGSVFLGRNNKPISRNTVWRYMKSLCSQAGVSKQKVFPHNLRHLFARTFYNIEKDIAKLADILGHSNVNTTRIYIMTSGIEHKQQMRNMRLLA